VPTLSSPSSWSRSRRGLHTNVSLNRPADRTWRRPPGRPRNKWVDQLRNDSTLRPTGELWRRAVDRGHGGATTRRPSPGVRARMSRASCQYAAGRLCCACGSGLSGPSAAATTATAAAAAWCQSVSQSAWCWSDSVIAWRVSVDVPGRGPVHYGGRSHPATPARSGCVLRAGCRRARAQMAAILSAWMHAACVDHCAALRGEIQR